MVGLLCDGLLLNFMLVGSILSMLVVVLDDFRGNFTWSVLLARALVDRRAADHGHGRARAVMNKIWRRGDARTAVRAQEAAVVVANLTVGTRRLVLAVIASGQLGVVAVVGHVVKLILGKL